MTCIVGCENQGKVYIGADSGVGHGYVIRALRRPKVFYRGPFIIGCSGSVRMSQLLQHSLKVPTQENGSEERYMVCVFVEAVRACLKEHGYLRRENNMESIGSFLVGYRGRLYRMASDLQIIQLLDGLAACGCGEEYALGAMFSLRDQGLAPSDRILAALTTTAYFCNAVLPPFAVVHT